MAIANEQRIVDNETNLPQTNIARKYYQIINGNLVETTENPSQGEYVLDSILPIIDRSRGGFGSCDLHSITLWCQLPTP